MPQDWIKIHRQPSFGEPNANMHKPQSGSLSLQGSSSPMAVGATPVTLKDHYW